MESKDLLMEVEIIESIRQRLMMIAAATPATITPEGNEPIRYVQTMVSNLVFELVESCSRIGDLKGVLEKMDYQG